VPTAGSPAGVVPPRPSGRARPEVYTRRGLPAHGHGALDRRRAVHDSRERLRARGPRVRVGGQLPRHRALRRPPAHPYSRDAAGPSRSGPAIRCGPPPHRPPHPAGGRCRSSTRRPGSSASHDGVPTASACAEGGRDTRRRAANAAWPTASRSAAAGNRSMCSLDVAWRAIDRFSRTPPLRPLSVSRRGLPRLRSDTAAVRVLSRSWR
jgi:hypothetical protein